jgi:pyruvate oxidase/acetolactate synthase-1/2/3 large subunit
MEEHECPTCGHQYEKKPQNIRFEDLPEKWRCPICNVPKNDFIPKTPKKK